MTETTDTCPPNDKPSAAPPGSAPLKTDKDWNDLRCIAHDIIYDLHGAKQQGQIELLLMACMLAHKSLDPQTHATWCQNALDTIKAAAEWATKKQNREITGERSESGES